MIDAPKGNRVVRSDPGFDRLPRAMLLPEIDAGQLVGGPLIQRVSRFAIVGACAVALIAIAAVASRDTSIVRATGVLEPGRIWFARSEEGGIIEQVRVGLGQSVSAGETLATLDTARIVEEIDVLRAQVRTLELQWLHLDAEEERQRGARLQRIALARARVARADAAWRDRLTEHGYVPRPGAPQVAEGTHIVLDMAMAEVRAANAELALTELDTIRARTNEVVRQQRRQQRGMLSDQIARLEKRRSAHAIRAPAAGIVLAGDARELNGVAVVPGQPVLQLGDPDEWRVTIQLSDEDVRKIQLGAVARLEPNGTRSISGSILTATVDFIAPVSAPGASGDRGRYYRVEARLDTASLRRLNALQLRRGHGVAVGFSAPTGSRMKAMLSSLSTR